LREFLASVESGEFFRQHARWFNPDNRIDRELLSNLKDTRELLDEASQRNIAPSILDSLLCRLVFSCYLFDRKVIGADYLRERLKLKDASHLRDILNLQPVREAKEKLYGLFRRLGKDFNGDLFSDDLDAEEQQITQKHIHTLKDFFEGARVRKRQLSFWPYDFGVVPVETISAIYEHFLKASDHQAGAFYTPRVLAEVVLDNALGGTSLLGKRFLDPACGSGIFLVGLFNRLAEEWNYANPTARNMRRARELMGVLRGSLFGVDTSATACRITAFSLYLAYMDQLSPRDIRVLQRKGQALPRLVATPPIANSASARSTANILCVDFFAKETAIPKDVDLVVGNPPWGSIATKDTLAGVWCRENRKIVPDNQIATAFVWKAVEHVAETGNVSLVLPHGTLFNHGKTAVGFQKSWVSQHTIHRVLNLADFRWFLFEKAVHPAIVVSYQRSQPKSNRHRIEYWAPKAEWLTTQAEIISVSPSDRSQISVEEILRDLNGPDAPQSWKRRFWGSPRDIRLIDKLALHPRLRDHVRSSRDKDSSKPWVMAEGFQPLGKNDDADKAHELSLPSTKFIKATSRDLDLFLLPTDGSSLSKASVTVREKSNKNTEVFRAPHVLITKGFKRIAFADFDVSFQHALRGIHGPDSYRHLLLFLTAYLRTPLARYFMFHTSSSWGMYRPEGHVEEVLRLPMPFPDQLSDPAKGNELVNQVARIVTDGAKRSEQNFILRSTAIQEATAEIEPLVNEYFGIDPVEQLLIADTINIIIPSIQPTQNRMPVPTVKHSGPQQWETYKNRVCETLNGWSKGTPFAVRGKVIGSSSIGIGMAVLEKVQRADRNRPMPNPEGGLLDALDRLRKVTAKTNRTLDPFRGLMVFDRDRLYVVKPIGQRYWSETAALNDADEIAGTILMHSSKASA
jgi:type I restriction-modification system DNA methylase subunit